MPYAAKLGCTFPGCQELVNSSGLCADHKRKRQQRCDADRGSASARGYDRAWQRLRELKLAADPFCEIQTHCKDLSLARRIAVEVDHTIRIRERLDLRLVWRNLRSSCHACHSAKSMGEMKHGARQQIECRLKTVHTAD